MNKEWKKCMYKFPKSKQYTAQYSHEEWIFHARNSVCGVEMEIYSTHSKYVMF